MRRAAQYDRHASGGGRAPLPAIFQRVAAPTSQILSAESRPIDHRGAAKRETEGLPTRHTPRALYIVRSRDRGPATVAPAHVWGVRLSRSRLLARPESRCGRSLDENFNCADSQFHVCTTHPLHPKVASAAVTAVRLQDYLLTYTRKSAIRVQITNQQSQSPTSSISSKMSPPCALDSPMYFPRELVVKNQTCRE